LHVLRKHADGGQLIFYTFITDQFVHLLIAGDEGVPMVADEAAQSVPMRKQLINHSAVKALSNFKGALERSLHGDVEPVLNGG
jgi:hypothetical protein